MVGTAVCWDATGAKGLGSKPPSVMWLGAAPGGGRACKIGPIVALHMQKGVVSNIRSIVLMLGATYPLLPRIVVSPVFLQARHHYWPNNCLWFIFAVFITHNNPVVKRLLGFEMPDAQMNNTRKHAVQLGAFKLKHKSYAHEPFCSNVKLTFSPSWQTILKKSVSCRNMLMGRIFAALDIFQGLGLHPQCSGTEMRQFNV